MVGRTIGEYKSIVSCIRNNGYVPGGNDGQGLQKLDLSNLKFVVHAETAVECALLDLMGNSWACLSANCWEMDSRGIRW